jgi:N-acetylmuramoyl-L-alanine amidase
MKYTAVAILTLAATSIVGGTTLMAAGPRELYTRALARERAIRDADRPVTVRQLREAVAAYERVVDNYPASGYSDNALWQAGNLALLAFQRFGEQADRKAGLRLLKQLEEGYPSSSLLDGIDEVVAAFESAPPPAEQPAGKPAAAPAPAAVPTRGEEKPAARATTASSQPGEVATIRAITRTSLADGLRVTIEMDNEVVFHHERLENPRRVFFDLRGARPTAELTDATLKFPDDVVQEIRLGRHPQRTTRVVMDMKGVDSYSVFTLYNPYRLIVDFRRPAGVVPASMSSVDSMKLPPLTRLKSTSKPVESQPLAAPAAEKEPPLVSRPAAPPALSAPSVPAANSNGQFSLSRQLGLGVSRVVIDAGHGGHDPGARSNGLNEAELVLDVAQRLKKLFEKQPGMDVVMTRDSDVFIPLDERTAIANREAADLFLSIHANASRNSKAHGVETYFLNFASNPEAAAVAARENSASGRAMHSLPDIVRAIALNNKIDESRVFAEMVQKSMVRRLAPRNPQLRDLGVKQAPFVVLIGASMPSVLAEISFVTNRQEGQLLKTSAYRQHIAEALFEAVGQYQKALKAKQTIAAREDHE